ncbi:MAG TPA: YceI family protein [Rhodoglobus sp.]|jgi:polyisoprenoid-binding protein YceI|nr:YceI family protein [Rhodoglobus sp.]HPG75967.1 YceI family protein [Rhodoglobus sp.]HQA23031.1 YceI family protein [Rhodoglobus sp.]HQI64864.1 YceI family protein [Rhodoglobus sp.]
MTTSTSIHPDYITGTWKLDPSHSEVSFTVKHLMISKVRGVFETFDVTIVTAENPHDSTIEATIDVASVNTGNEGRDNHLRTSDFFLVEEHPTMSFVSTSFDGEPDDFSVTGDLTLRGVTKSVVLKGEFGGIITDGYGNTRAGATATAKINRHDFGVNWNAALEAGGMTLGDDVTITLDLQVILQP